MGDARSILRNVGGAFKTAALQTAQGAVQGAQVSITDKLKSWLLPAPAGGPRGLQAGLPSYLPWVVGGVAVLGLSYAVLRK